MIAPMNPPPESPPLRIVFAGTPEFAATALDALIASPHEVVAVYTQPDRPAGRGRKLTPSPVKQLALQHDIPVLQPENFKSQHAIDELATLQPAVMVVAAYGLILPPAVLETPHHGCLNIHASLLPRWRGAAPIQRAILADDPQSGVTIMQMAKGLDTGDMLLKSACPITATTTAAQLHDQLAKLGAADIVKVLDQVSNGTLKPEPQNDTDANYAHKISKEEAQIDWQQPSEEIERMIRAFNPWPVAYTTLEGKTLRIRAADNKQQSHHSQPGCVISSNKNGVDIACGQGVLRLLNLQPPGKKAMDAAAFYNGYPDMLKTGTQLGNPS